MHERAKCSELHWEFFCTLHCCSKPEDFSRNQCLFRFRSEMFRDQNKISGHQETKRRPVCKGVTLEVEK